MNNKDFYKRYDLYKSIIEEDLKNSFKSFNKSNDTELINAINYSLLNGGKRVRATLILAFCEMFGYDLKKVKEVASSVEMLHCYSLIHDDLPCMDNDDFRRGKPSCHVKYGEAVALLAGDALLTQCFYKISNCNLSLKKRIEIIKILSFSCGYNGMILGQALDLYYENKITNKKSLNLIHSKKTGMFIKACIKIAYIICEEDFLEKEEIFSNDLGLCFQIVDDILDVTSSKDELLKTSKSDIKNKKNTYVSIYGLKESKTISVELTKKCMNFLEENFKEKAYFILNFVNFLLKRNF